MSRLNTIGLVGTAGFVGHAPANRFLPDRLWQVTFSTVNPKFVYYWTRSSWYRSQVDAAGTDVSPPMKCLSQAEFGNFRLAMPPREEQTTIVRFLNQETAKIDALAVDLRRLIALLHEKRLAVVAHAVTKGLNPRVTMKCTRVDGLGDIPEHWKLKTIRSVANVTRGASPRPAGDPRYFGGDAVPWVTVAEITRNDRMELTKTRTCVTEAGARRSRRFAKGTVVYSNSGDTLGVPRILGMEACANDGVAAFEDLSPEVDPRFLCFFLGSITAAMREKATQGSGQPNLNTEIVKGIRFGLPPMPEQDEIAKHIAEWTASFCSLATDAQQAVDLLEERQTALVDAAVTGQIDVQGTVEA